MQSAKLYEVKRDDLKKVASVLTESFFEDPLYVHLMPDEIIRKRIMPEYFNCYLEMAAGESDMYADSAEINGVLTVYDSNKHINPFMHKLKTVKCILKMALMLVREDKSLKTAKSFFKSREFLTSKWENKVEDDDIIHIDLFAVRKKVKGTGIAGELIRTALTEADSRDFSMALETHNPKNVEMYKHFGFELFEMLAGAGELKQYCMVR